MNFFSNAPPIAGNSAVTPLRESMGLALDLMLAILPRCGSLATSCKKGDDEML